MKKRPKLSLSELPPREVNVHKKLSQLNLQNLTSYSCLATPIS